MISNNNLCNRKTIYSKGSNDNYELFFIVQCSLLQNKGTFRYDDYSDSEEEINRDIKHIIKDTEKNHSYYSQNTDLSKLDKSTKKRSSLMRRATASLKHSQLSDLSSRLKLNVCKRSFIYNFNSTKKKKLRQMEFKFKLLISQYS